MAKNCRRAAVQVVNNRAGACQLQLLPSGQCGQKLGRDFYARPVLAVARDCIGKVLVHVTPECETAGRIVEAEAYRGPLDLAAHSARGLTRRTAAMFGPPGYAYVFRLYGTCWAMNLVTTAQGEPHAVLIRALEPVRGLDLMAQRRHKSPASRELTNGPGKLTQALASPATITDATCAAMCSISRTRVCRAAESAAQRESMS